MAHDGQNEPCPESRHHQRSVEFEELVRIIGYQLTAFIGSTDVRTAARWLHEGVPEAVLPRMQAALEIAKPIERVESELVAQGFLAEEMSGIAPYRCAAEMLREADVRTACAVLSERVRKEFLENVAGDLEGIELRLGKWISQASLPPGTAYSVHLSPDRNRLWLQLIHTGSPVDRLRKWDRGEDWPCWDEVIQEIPEIATARTRSDLQTGFPFKYLRRVSD
jgi:hypothetical protein